ncbi:RDD family protein [uncultured Nocardioides sp.]|uniref:RDD family protein n=1 Tax=uncultured Nocardioides sp. TaxID=198441 RepID=UPI002616DC04|nr:RDD family protein [uncultured Nocardioides sp.]
MTTTLPPGPAVLPATAVRPADLERRLHAYALDRVAGWGLPLGLAAALVVGGATTWLVVLAPLLLGAVLVVLGATLLSTRGATPGMALLGLRVETPGGALTLPDAVRRQAVLALAGLPTFGLGLATLAWTAAADVSGRRRGWHDELVGTVVVDARPVPAAVVGPERPQPIVNLTAMRLVPPEPTAASVPPDVPVTPPPAAPFPATGEPAPTPTPAATPEPPAPAPGRRRAAAPAATRAPEPVPPRRAARPETRWRATADTGETVLVRGLTLLGRGPQPREGESVADLVALPSTDMSVSKTHAQLQLSDDGSLVVMDRGSTNGSVLIRQGVPRHLSPGRPVTLLDGDVLRLGDRVLEISGER